MSGMVQGGWEYVWIVYSATWTVLVAYTFSLLVRGRNL